MLPGFIYCPSGEINQETTYRRDRVTDTWPRGVPVPSPAVAMIMGSGGIIGLAYLERGDAVTSFERRIAVSHIQLRSLPLPPEQLITRTAKHMRQRARTAFESGGQVSPATWAAMRAVLLEDEMGNHIRRLEQKATPPQWLREADSNARQIVEWEQDATGLALSFENHTRRELTAWIAPEAPLPFLAGIEGTPLREDQLLLHDTGRFGDWDARGARGFITTFESRGGRRVAVMNVNRHGLESTLGADLIYYNDANRSYIIVQYKRLRWEGRPKAITQRLVYRPAHDKNLTRQLNRMRKVEAGMADERARKPGEYRLGPGICFLKLCRPDLDLGSSDLCQGMYIGLDLWDLTVAKTNGSRKTPVLSYESGTRYLNNTEFIDLVRGGWIGSTGKVTARIEEYINRSLTGRHSVTLAAGTT